MKSKIILKIIFAFLTTSCQNKVKKFNKLDVKIETKKWKQELIINGEVGNPCQENIDKWAAENPERYYGLPKDSIQSKSFDANNDKINDLLLYFKAGDCCSLLYWN